MDMDSDDLDTAQRNDRGATSAERTLENAINHPRHEPDRDRNEAVYGDSDMDPNAEDQHSAHSAANDDEIV